jgi:WD40 repeat protein
VDFSTNGKRIATGGADKTVRLWEVPSAKPEGVVATRKAVVALEAHTDFVRDLAFTSDGKYLVSSGKDGPVRVWDVRDRKLSRVLEAHDGLVRSLALSPDDKFLVTAGRDGKLLVWDFASGKVRAKLDEGVSGWPCFHPTTTPTSTS